jgi:hypothetical protein
MPYLRLTLLARRAHDIVGARRSDIAHPIFARVVLLRIVFDLWWGQPRVFPIFVSVQYIVYLGVVGTARAVAVNRRRVNGRRVWAWWWL